MGIPGGSAVKNKAANAPDTGDTCLICGSGRSPGGGNGNPLQYSCLENSKQRVKGVVKMNKDILYSMSFPGGTMVKNPPASAGDIRDVGLIPGLGRSPGGGHGNLLQYSCLENLKDRGAWRATVPGVT